MPPRLRQMIEPTNAEPLRLEGSAQNPLLDLRVLMLERFVTHLVAAVRSGEPLSLPARPGEIKNRRFQDQT